MTILNFHWFWIEFWWIKFIDFISINFELNWLVLSWIELIHILGQMNGIELNWLRPKVADKCILKEIWRPTDRPSYFCHAYVTLHVTHPLEVGGVQPGQMNSENGRSSLSWVDWRHSDRLRRPPDRLHGGLENIFGVSRSPKLFKVGPKVPLKEAPRGFP